MKRWAVFAGVSCVTIAAVAAVARRDAADPARCGELVPMGHRCCAPGQREERGLCVGRPTACPDSFRKTDEGCVAIPSRIAVSGATFRVGAGDWEAEGRVLPHDVTVAPFAIDRIEITEAAYAECVLANQCTSLLSKGEPGRAQAGMNRADAERYCAFRGGRLPTSDEWALAAAGARGRRYPWGETGAVCRRATWGLSTGPCAFGHEGAELAGAHPEGATPEGVHDLAGNVAEWVAGAPEEQDGVVRGGSFAAELATDLRTWRTVRVAADTRSPRMGARCAYDAPRPDDAPSPDGAQAPEKP